MSDQAGGARSGHAAGKVEDEPEGGRKKGQVKRPQIRGKGRCHMNSAEEARA